LARTIETSFGGITDVDFSPGGLLLAAGSWEGSVGLLQLSDGHLLRTLQGNENRVRDVAFSPDGKTLASASDDHAIRLWQVSDGSLVHTLQVTPRQFEKSLSRRTAPSWLPLRKTIPPGYGRLVMAAS